MAQCPNCNTPCVGCAGAKLTTASDGKAVCTKCIAAYEMSKGRNPNQPGPSPSNQVETSPSGSLKPTINKITFNNLNT